MEAQSTAPATTPAPATAPAPEVANVTYQAPQVETGGAMEAITKPKWNVKDIVLSGFLLAMSISVIIYTRLAIKKLNEQPSSEDFDNLSEDIEELKFNLKKALGNKYQKT